MSKTGACLLMCAPSVSHSPFKAERLPGCLFVFGSALGEGTPTELCVPTLRVRPLLHLNRLGKKPNNDKIPIYIPAMH